MRTPAYLSELNGRRLLRHLGAVIAVTLGLLPAFAVTPAYAAAPSNDALSHASSLGAMSGSTSFSTTGTNTEATVEAGEQDHAGHKNHSVWWTFFADCYGSMTLDTAGSGFDTVLAVQVTSSAGFTATPSLGDTIVAENDDAPGATDNHSAVTFNLKPGYTYSVAVDGFSATSVGNIKLNLSFTGTAPPNDAVANADGVTLPLFEASPPFVPEDITFPATVYSTTSLASTEPGEPAHNGHVANSVWYRMVAPRNGTLDVSLESDTGGFGLSDHGKVFAVQAGPSLDGPLVAEGTSPSLGTTAQHAVFAMVKGRTYSIVVDRDHSNFGYFALTINLTTAPKAPSDPASVPSDSAVDITWQPPTNMGQGNFVRWEVFDQNGRTACVSTSKSATQCSATGLTNGSSYEFRVRGITEGGNGEWSDWSTSVTPTAVATKPLHPAAAVGNTSATISWDEPIGDGGSFTNWEVVKADGSAACTSTVRATRSCTATGLTNGTSYQFKVRLVNAAGNGEWSDLTAAVTPHVLTAAGAPAAPTATAGDGQVSLAWAEPAAMGDGTFTKWEVANAGGTTVCAVTDRATRTCTVTGLTNGTASQFKVRAVTSAGNGAFSALSTAVTPQPSVVATAPDSPSASAGDGQASVTWDVPSSMGNGTFTRWEVVRSDGTAGCTSTTLVNRTCTATGLTNGTSYQFKVRAVTNAGNGAWSTLTSSVTPTAAPTVATAPAAPSATAGDGQVSLSWNAPSSMGNGTFTTWEVQTSSGADACHSNDRLVRSCTVTGLSNGASYQFKVRAVTSAGNGAFSALSTAVTPLPSPTLATAPDSPSASAGDTQAAVSWDVPSSMGNGSFTKWEVVRSDGTAACTSTTQATRTCTVTGLTNGTSYQFKVRAVTSVGNGPWSTLTAPVTPTAPASGGSTPTVADAPPAPLAKAGNGQVSLKWSAPSSLGSYSTFETWEVQTADGSDACHSNDRLVRSCTATDLTNGTSYQFKVRAVTSSGNGAWSDLSVAASPDGTNPSAAMTAPTAAFSLAPEVVSWAGSDAGGSGVSSFQVRYTRASFSGGFGAPVYPSAWQNLSAATTQLTASTPAGSTDCFSVQAKDSAGNLSGWSAPKCSAAPLDDRSLSASAGWTKGTGSSFYLGTFAQTSTLGKTLSRASVQLKRIALVVTKCAGCGSVKVQVGSATIGTVSLNAATTKSKQLVLLPTFSLRSGTVTLTVTTSGKKVIIDGLGVSRM